MAVRLTPVGDSHDEHDQFAVEYLVQHPVVADSNAAQASQASFEAAAGVWLVGEAVYRVVDPSTLRFGDAGGG
ncbi:MAG: hypothetical protein OXH86_20260 [Acidimicrobiaceae bacterium]|nr:hypothetical protein [Acidimicrobiaceae bacterium]MDE0499680.1 hypothetical protein [Acidimicrobiaceae bacterium]